MCLCTQRFPFPFIVLYQKIIFTQISKNIMYTYAVFVTVLYAHTLTHANAHTRTSHVIIIIIINTFWTTCASYWWCFDRRFLTFDFFWRVLYTYASSSSILLVSITHTEKYRLYYNIIYNALVPVHRCSAQWAVRFEKISCSSRGERGLIELFQSQTDWLAGNCCGMHTI